jgi:hypothetical protein
MKNSIKGIGALTTLSLGAVLALGCNTTLILDDELLEQSIATGISEQMGVSATVACPDDRPISQGDVFTCTATTTDGQQITVQVTQTDATGNVEWETL